MAMADNLLHHHTLVQLVDHYTLRVTSFGDFITETRDANSVTIAFLAAQGDTELGSQIDAGGIERQPG